MSKIEGDINLRMKQATPREELERQIMSHFEPKNEREHWAAREIESLRDQLAAAQAREAELTAHVERLREALETACRHIELHSNTKNYTVGRDALTATPAQSLACLRNEVLEEAATVCDKSDGHYCAKAIRAMKEPE